MVWKWLRRGAGAASAAGDEKASWVVKRAGRLQENRDGQVLEYPGRIVVCPRGHERTIPTRFDRPVSELTCGECGRKYPLELES